MLPNLPAPIKPLPERIRVMHIQYGLEENRTCQQCHFFLRVRANHTYFKCSKTRMSRSSATDWRASWPACGLFDPAENQTVHTPKP